MLLWRDAATGVTSSPVNGAGTRTGGGGVGGGGSVGPGVWDGSAATSVAEGAGVGDGPGELVAATAPPGNSVPIWEATTIPSTAIATPTSANRPRRIVLAGGALDSATSTPAARLSDGAAAPTVRDMNEISDPRDRARAVRDLTEGGGDVVCEFVGHASALREGIQMVAPGGRYLECGCIHTGTSFEFDPAYLTLLSRTVHGVIYYEPWALREGVRFLDRHRDDYPWKQLLAARYPLERIDQAFADAGARRVPRAAIEP